MVLEDETERFLLYLEWLALRSALNQYKGLEAGGRSKLASIEYDSDGVKISLAILPIEGMPKRVPSCAEQK